MTFAGNVSLSAEPGDYDFGEYDLGHYSDEESDVDADALTLSAVVGIPLGPFTELYGKACIADVSAEVNDDDFDASEALTRISHHPSTAPKLLSFFSILLIFTWNTSNLITK